LPGRDFVLDGIEEADEFAVSVALHPAADLHSIEHAERSDHSVGAIDIYSRTSWFGSTRHRSANSAACGRLLGSGFFIERKYHGMDRGSALRPTMLARLLAKLGSRKNLKGRMRCGYNW
jgi:hypothetical protein